MPSRLKSDETPITLLAVTGVSPAILTETLWALAHNEGIVPSRIIAITTTVGRNKLGSLWLPDPELGGATPWDALRSNIQAKGLALEAKLRFGQTPDDIRVITRQDPINGRSVELDDIRSVADNNAAADYILDQVRSIVFNPDTHLIASIAGGRKTMGTLLYAAVSLLARESDRITHVLVAPPFESLPGFWFPGQPSGTPQKKSRLSKTPLPDIELADLPFVPLRRKVVENLGREPGSFHTLSALCRDDSLLLAPPSLSLSETTPGCRVNDLSVALGPREHSLLLFLCNRVAMRETPLGDYKSSVEIWAAYRAEIYSRRSKLGDDWRISCKSKVDVDALKHDISSIREKLKKIGPAGIALGKLLPTRGRFSLDIDRSKITIT